MASCVWNIHAKNNQNLTIGFKVTVENVRVPVFLRQSVIPRITGIDGVFGVGRACDRPKQTPNAFQSSRWTGVKL